MSMRKTQNIASVLRYYLSAHEEITSSLPMSHQKINEKSFGQLSATPVGLFKCRGCTHTRIITKKTRKKITYIKLKLLLTKK